LLDSGQPDIGLFVDSLARGRNTGVGTYVVNLIEHLLAVRPQRRLTIVSPAVGTDLGPRAKSNRLRVLRLRGPAQIRTALNLTTDWPSVDRGLNLDLLHILVPGRPAPCDAPLVMTIHDLTPLTHPEWYSRRATLLFEQSVKRALAVGAHFTTDSQAVHDEARSLLGIPPERITVALLGAPPSPRAPSTLEVRRVLTRLGLGQRPFLLFLGEISPRKDPVAVVEVLRILRSSGVDVDVAFAGAPGRASADLESAIGRYELGGHAHVFGHVDAVTAAVLMQEASVYILPSRYEGFGLPVLEAMQRCTPVVATAAGSLPEVVGDGGLLAEIGDFEALAARSADVLSDPCYASRQAQAGLRQVERFSWRHCAEVTASAQENALTCHL